MTTLTSPRRLVRPLDAELHGYAWLPRMIDKARAAFAGDAEGLLFGCPIDHTALARLGVHIDDFARMVRDHDTDEGVFAALRAHGIPPALDAWFDAPLVEEEAQAGFYLKVRPAERVDELAAPPGDHVILVEQGAATIFLGFHQARRVEAGEVVRAPAGALMRVLRAGSEPLRLVHTVA